MVLDSRAANQIWKCYVQFFVCLLCVCVCWCIVCTYSHVTWVKLVIDSRIMPQWQQWPEWISAFVYPFVCVHVGESICLSVCVCVFVLWVRFLCVSFTAKPPLSLTLWVASPHFVPRLLPYLLERQSVGTLIKKALMLISSDMTSWHA